MLDTFREHYGSADGVRVFRAPGRVNLIGEHTDYNLGFVLPVALQLATQIATGPSRDGTLRIYSEHRAEMREFPVDQIPNLTPAHEWTDYLLGVAVELILAGYPIAPANLLVRSTVPEGSGLSSSAALEVSTALALLAGRPIDPLDLARLCQRAERNFVGVPCGIMDQYISVFGRENSAVEIDCRSLGHRLVPLPAGTALVAVNTMVKHALAGSAYKDRVAECSAAVTGLRSQFPSIQSLRDVTRAEFDSVGRLFPPVVARRARHVVTEDERVSDFVDASMVDDPNAMGRLMVESHRSLRDDYEVSCAELDFLADLAVTLPGVYGSRMTGGGFGGCTVTLLREDAVAAFQDRIAAAYQEQFDLTPQIYRCQPSAGAGEVNESR